MHEFADNGIPETQLAIEHLMAADEAQFGGAAVDFVMDRVGQLAHESFQAEGPIHRHQGPYDAFIAFNTEIRPKPEGTGFYVDDASAYKLTLERMHALHKPEDGPLSRPEYVGKALQAVQAMEGDYFDSMAPGPEQELVRNLAMLQGAIPGSKPVRPPSISELKDVAFCTERAALAHNSLRILGVRSELVFGAMEVEGETFAHTFLKVEDGQDGSMVYDPTNPWLAINEARELTGVKPAATSLPETEGVSRIDTSRKLFMQAGDETQELEQPCAYLLEYEQSAEDEQKTKELLAKLALVA
jgi:hypothetical protein